MTSKRRRKLDQYLRGSREDPELVIQQMANFSNRLFRVLVGLGLTAIMAFLVIWPLGGNLEWSTVVGMTVLIFLLNGLAWQTMMKIQPQVFDRPAAFNQLILLVPLTIAVSWILFQTDGGSPFLAPLPMLAMVLTMTFGQPVALFVVASVGLYLGLLSPLTESMQVDVVLAIVLSAGGVVSVLGMGWVRQQSRPFVVGAYAGLTQGVMLLAFTLIGIHGEQKVTLASFNSWSKVGQILVEPGWAMAGGLVSGALVTCFLPALERFFKVLTERRLLALNDPSTELLEVLRNRAPGTHTHSLRVADLASAAAEAIGVDSLLSRVGAYYHDIGKITKPEYFVENLETGVNAHDRLRPSMSKLIIISHVKEGVELAEEARLPQKLIDMIPMHHGTTVVEYFYHKAKTEVDAREQEVEYRYPGPKPTFPEAGILMLADGVEASAKAIAEPNPGRFRDMVHQMVLKRLLDRQLDECELTMRDLARIEDSFVRTLTHMYHGRIRYPEKTARSDKPADRPREQNDETQKQPRNHHRQPAEITSATSRPAAKNPHASPSGS